jgi:hypothetical protein
MCTQKRKIPLKRQSSGSSSTVCLSLIRVTQWYAATDYNYPVYHFMTRPL